MSNKYILAILKEKSHDDGMVSVETGCVNGNGKKSIAVLNLNNCICLDDKLVTFLTENWDEWCDSPEYVLCQKLLNLKDR